MRIKPVEQTGGGIQFVVSAENDAEALLLKLFDEQCREETFWRHGSSCRTGKSSIRSFNFGTIKKEVVSYGKVEETTKADPFGFESVAASIAETPGVESEDDEADEMDG